MTEPKNKGGRPLIVLTDEQIKEIEQLARNGVSCDIIADHLGIGESTFYEVKKRDDRVFRAYKKGCAGVNVEVIGHLLNKIRDGCATTGIFWAKTRLGWSEKNNLNITSEDGSMSPREITVNFKKNGKKVEV